VRDQGVLGESTWRHKAIRIAAVAVAAAALLVGLGPTVVHWLSSPPSSSWEGQADALGLELAGPLRAQAIQQQVQVFSVGVAVAPIYRNPVRDVSGLVPERIDQGVDFSGSGPVFALGDAVVLQASGANFGWPGGGWITYQLTDGPDQGLVVYLAEDVTPSVVAGQHVTASTVVGQMFEGGDGIETGWATSDGANAESQQAAAGGIGGAGPFPTTVGTSFDRVLVALGAPAAPNLGQTPSGLLPPGYPTAS
jgi:hypothetical protein